MIKTISINDVPNSVQMLIALTKNGDEIVIEENGKPLARVIPFDGNDLENEFSAWEAASDEDFLNFESKLAETK
ncbi:MAG: hypothetical protein M3525_03485 [Acidobacteriota bacterium]|nr:hypothetical protein [Acidobacteriota bacterium]